MKPAFGKWIVLGTLVCLFTAALTFNPVPATTQSAAALAVAPTLAVYLPVVMRPSGAIIIDHTTVNINLIPTEYITLAKSMLRASYGHTSHGSQLITGADYWYDQNSIYAFTTNGSILPNYLSVADYTPNTGDLGNPNFTQWEIDTRAYLNSSGSNRNVVMWSWCGEVSWASEANINTYLSLMSGLEYDYPNVKFVYMTGHLDGEGQEGNLYQRNNQIRAYVRANHKILFDFADIESYNPDGTYFPDGSDACEWCGSWCTAHPGQCSDLPTGDWCAHSHAFNCKLKGQGFWWLMARLAGWNGVPATP